MPRMNEVTTDQATGEVADLFGHIKQKMGRVPNIMQAMGNSAAALKVYTQTKAALAGGKLSLAEQEVIALVTAEVNHCDYCAAAHTGAARKAGFSADEVLNIRKGEPTDEKHQALAQFVQRIVETNGFVEDSDIQAAHDAGYDDEYIAEIIANIALNYYTNIINHVNDTEIDFPAVPQLSST